MATHFDEHEVGKFPNFVIYAVAEWVLIILLFLDGFISFAANELAKVFHLKTPCLICTRIDHLLVQRNFDFYYNDSICESHKKEVSSLAFCHNHRKLSDIRKMCENCLLSFATEKESHIDTYKSLVGILHKDLECSVETDHRVQHSSRDDGMHGERTSSERCSCCNAPLKVKSNNPKAKNAEMFTQAPTPSPRAYPHGKHEDSCAFDVPHAWYPELKGDSEFGEAEDGFNVNNLEAKLTEDSKAASVPLLTETDEEIKTPSSAKGNRMLGFSFTDPAGHSPKLSCRINRKSLLEKTELTSDSKDGNIVTNEVVDDSIFYHLNRQVGLDRKSLVALYMELDEERNAAAVAANNALAMITRLQAEKAAVQMEALQYQRMMEEQAEYDEEALQATNEMLIKREEETKALEAELQIYRGRYGRLTDFSFKEDMDFQEFDSPLKLEEGEDNQEGSLNIKGGYQMARNIFHSRESSYGSVEAGNMTDMAGREGEACLSLELYSLNERLKALEADSEFKELVGKEYEPDSEETRLLTQILQNLEKLRHHVVTTSEGEGENA